MTASELVAFFLCEATFADEEAEACRRLSTMSSSPRLNGRWRALALVHERYAIQYRARAGKTLALPAIGRAGARP